MFVLPRIRPVMDSLSAIPKKPRPKALIHWTVGNTFYVVYDGHIFRDTKTL